MKFQIRRLLSIGISLLAVGLPLASNVTTAQAAGKFVVDDDKAQCPKAGFTTIQAAVAAAGAGPAKITVCAGTYQGQVHIQNTAKIKLIAKPGVTLRPDIDPFDQSMILVEDSTLITVQGFTIDGQYGLSNTPSANAAIEFENSSGSILRNTIVNWHEASFPATRFESGIRVGGTGVQTIKIDRNTIPDLDGIGIEVFNMGKTKVTRNLLAAVSTAVNGSSGLGIERTQDGVISGNIITADAFPGAGSFDAISVESVNNMAIKGNTVTGAEYGILMQTIGGFLTNNKVKGNKLIQVRIGIQVGAYGIASSDGNADFNKITGNKIINTTTGDNGVLVQAESSFLTLAHANNLVVKGNKITNFSVPIDHTPGTNGAISGVFAPNSIIP